eukprot:1057645-Rhodomonas_salina.2
MHACQRELSLSVALAHTAAEAALLAVEVNDKIVAVDGNNLKGKTSEQIISLIVGPPGTIVELLLEVFPALVSLPVFFISPSHLSPTYLHPLMIRQRKTADVKRLQVQGGEGERDTRQRRS